MNYVRIKFTEDIADIDAQIQKTMNEMFSLMNPMFFHRQNVRQPQIDIYEQDDEIVVLAEMSGVRSEDIDVILGPTSIKIYATRRKPELTERMRYRLAEIYYGRFERTVSLPAPIDTEHVTATCVDGLLQIRLPKSVPDNRLRKIIVQQG